MGCDRTNNVTTTFADGLNRGSRGAVLKHDSQFRETFMEGEKRGKECCLGVQNGYLLVDTRFRIWWSFAVEVEDDIFLLHGFEDWVERFVVHNSAARIGGHASWVGFHSCDAGFLGGSYRVGCDRRVEVQ